MGAVMVFLDVCFECGYQNRVGIASGVFLYILLYIRLVGVFDVLADLELLVIFRKLMHLSLR